MRIFIREGNPLRATTGGDTAFFHADIMVCDERERSRFESSGNKGSGSI